MLISKLKHFVTFRNILFHLGNCCETPLLYSQLPCLGSHMSGFGSPREQKEHLQRPFDSGACENSRYPRGWMEREAKSLLTYPISEWCRLIALDPVSGPCTEVNKQG